MRFLSSVAVLAMSAASALAAAIPLSSGTGGSYTQSFDGLVTSSSVTYAADPTTASTGGIPGWFFARTGTGTTIVADAGSGTAGGLYSYGTGTTSDRAVGSIGSGNAAAGSFAYGAYFVNNTGSTIESVKVGVTLEQWRKGGGTTAQVLPFSYRIGGAGFTTPTSSGVPSGWTAVTALDLSSPINTSSGTALDGNAAANRVVVAEVTLPSVSLANGGVLWVRWEDPDHSGTDHGTAIDNFSLTYVVPEPASLGLLGLASLVGLRRRSR